MHAVLEMGVGADASSLRRFAPLWKLSSVGDQKRKIFVKEEMFLKNLELLLECKCPAVSLYERFIKI